MLDVIIFQLQFYKEKNPVQIWVAEFGISIFKQLRTAPDSFR